MNNQKIVVVEDEPKIAQLLDDYLTEAGYSVATLGDGSDAVEFINAMQPDCVILDIMLPGKDGLAICRELSQTSMVPIVMITARIDEIDRLLGLELGADDYICKPFSPREVVVRIRNILRRVSHLSEHSSRLSTADGQNAAYIELVHYRSLSLDPERMKCLVAESPVSLTAVEFRMLYTMLQRPGCIFSRNQLMNSAYTDERVVSDRTIDTHIKNLRKKLQDNQLRRDRSTELIHSIYGVGYKVE